jgi:hypothetical protein
MAEMRRGCVQIISTAPPAPASIMASSTIWGTCVQQME